MNLHRPYLKSGIALVLACASASNADAAKSIVRFANKDVLTGAMESITQERLLWNSPLLGRPSSFFIDKILDISLTPSLPEETHDHETTVTLTNGDTIRGQLASVTDETVSLDTWFAGRMNFNRLMVSGVKVEQRAALVYRGPTGMDGWQQAADPPVWNYQRSAFLSSGPGGIARANLLPDECSVSFDTAWRGDSIRLRVILFSDDPSTDNPSSGYELSFQRGSIHLRNCKTQSFIGSAQSRVLMENDKARIGIRASAKNNRVALFINDQIIEVWNDPDAAQDNPGRGLHFISGSTLPLRVSNIGVAQWDGVLDQMPDPQAGLNRRFGIPGMGMDEEVTPAAEEKSDETRMELANGDSLAGEVIAIHDGIITVNSPLGEIKLPVSRLRTVALKPVEAERSKRRNGDIRAWFHDGSSIVFNLESSDDETLTGSSQNFGTATFRTAAFNRIEFNIYSPEFEDLRRADEW